MVPGMYTKCQYLIGPSPTTPILHLWSQLPDNQHHSWWLGMPWPGCLTLPWFCWLTSWAYGGRVRKTAAMAKSKKMRICCSPFFLPLSLTLVFLCVGKCKHNSCYCWSCCWHSCFREEVYSGLEVWEIYKISRQYFAARWLTTPIFCLASLDTTQQ